MTSKKILETVASSDVFWPNDDSHLWLWSTNNRIKDGLWMVDQLGFRYVTMWTWVKTTKDGRVLKGLGQYGRGSTEHLLLAVRGKTMLPSTDNRPSTCIMGVRRKHSQKPEESYEVIEAVSPSPRLEMFARGPARAGWNTWGDETS